MNEQLIIYARGSMWTQKWFFARKASGDKAVHGRIGECQLVISEIQQIGKRVRFNYLIAWYAVGNAIENTSDKAQIADFISKLPSVDSLDELKSIQQLLHWINTKNFALRIAKCWDLERYEQPNNPLARELEEGSIDQWSHDFIWLQALWQQNLWKLICLKGKDIRTVLQSQFEYPFTSDRELFQEILRDQADSYFLKCTKPLYIEKADEIKKLGDLKSRQLRNTLSLSQRKKLIELESYYAPSQVWLKRVLKAAGELSQKDTLIHTLIATYNELLLGITRMQQKAYRNPDFKRHGQITSTWENGLNSPGIKPGWKA